MRTWTNVIVALLNWHALGQPSQGRQSSLLSMTAPSLHLQLYDRIVLDVESMVAAPLSKWSGGRQSIRERLQNLQRFDFYGGSTQGPEWLSSDNVAIPENASVVDLAGKHNHPALGAFFDTPHVFDRPEGEIPSVHPPACHRVRAGEWPKMVARGWKARLFRLSLPHDTPHIRGSHAAAGLFGVAKKLEGSLRLVID